MDHDPNRADIACIVPDYAFKTKRIDAVSDRYFTHVNTIRRDTLSSKKRQTRNEELETLLGSEYERLQDRLRLMEGKFEPRKDWRYRLELE